MTDCQWDRIKAYLPPERKAQGGRPAKDNRMILNAIIFWLNTGIAWSDVPERFGSWNTVYTRFRRWSQSGVWQVVFEKLLAGDIVDESCLMLDSTIIRVHQHGNAPKKEEPKNV